MKTVFLTTLALTFFGSILYSQDFDKEKLNTYFNTLEQGNKFMGSIAISQNENLIYTHSVGFSNIETQTKSDQNTTYRIGSISKTFTATLIMKAIELKQLKLNQTLDQFYPEISNAKKITIEQLLNHSSGIHDFTVHPDYFEWSTKPKSEKEMVEIITKGGSDFAPGSQHDYSNSNYVLLTYILEKINKLSYDEILKKYITKPIGLQNTYFDTKSNSTDHECNSYKFLGSWEIQPKTDPSVPMGAGGIVSTPSDLVKFSDALFAGKIIHQDSVERMKKMENGYGLGLFQSDFEDKLGWGHTGGIDGFSSEFIYFPKENLSFAIISNGVNFKTSELVNTVLQAVFGLPYEIPNFTAYRYKSEELDAYIGVYSSQEIPVKITVSKENLTLVAQAEGQPAFPLEATEKNQFKFDQAGILMEFNPEEKSFVLKQGGGNFRFTKP